MSKHVNLLCWKYICVSDEAYELTMSDVGARVQLLVLCSTVTLEVGYATTEDTVKLTYGTSMSSWVEQQCRCKGL